MDIDAAEEAEDGGDGRITLDLGLPRFEGPPADGLASLLVPPDVPGKMYVNDYSF